MLCDGDGSKAIERLDTKIDLAAFGAIQLVTHRVCKKDPEGAPRITPVVLAKYDAIGLCAFVGVPEWRPIPRVRRISKIVRVRDDGGYGRGGYGRCPAR